MKEVTEFFDFFWMHFVLWIRNTAQAYVSWLHADWFKCKDIAVKNERLGRRGKKNIKARISKISAV